MDTVGPRIRGTISISGALSELEVVDRTEISAESDKRKSSLQRETDKEWHIWTQKFKNRSCACGLFLAEDACLLEDEQEQPDDDQRNDDAENDGPLEVLEAHMSLHSARRRLERLRLKCESLRDFAENTARKWGGSRTQRRAS